MIEEMRKDSRLVKLLNVFYGAIGAIILVFFLRLFVEKTDCTKIAALLNIIPSFLGALAFQSIAVCVITFLGKFKRLFNEEWILRISALNFMFILIFESINGVVFGHALQKGDLVAAVVGVLFGCVLVYIIGHESTDTI